MNLAVLFRHAWRAPRYSGLLQHSLSLSLSLRRNQYIVLLRPSRVVGSRFRHGFSGVARQTRQFRLDMYQAPVHASTHRGYLRAN